MRILLWYWGRRGAGGQLTLALAEALARRQDVALALSLSRQADLRREMEALGLPMDAVDTFSGAAGFLLGTARVPLLARRLVRQARDFRADVVVSVMTHVWTPLVAPALRRAGIAFVPMVHDAEPHPGDQLGPFWEWRLGRELDAARCAIALSGAVAAALRARRPGLPVLRLPLGAHLPSEFLRAAPVRQAGGGPEFLLFGRLRAYKGLDLLRDAFHLLRLRHPEARLRVVGEGDAEGLAPGLASLPGVRVESRWVAEAEIPALIAAADALVLPYREASQSGVVSLAHAMGVPVV
ncbi:MAG: glycosyltransferase, partial [Acetobacteraceae bacterium]|nr:glycosyltransferase [Acetobacteraceae bacterium]